MDKVIAIIGPTGVGKTKLSVELAKILNGEIISCDSVQVYKEMNIGSAKIKEEEKEGIIHYLIDIKEINEDYSVYEFQKEVREKIALITSKHKVPILVGGTGLYLKAALYDYEFNDEENDNFNDYKELSNDEAYALLKSLDSKEASKLHPHNRIRVVRALNIIEKNKMSKTELLAKQEHKLLYDATFIGLTSSRDIIYNRINNRVDKMIDEGLLTEAKSLYDKYGNQDYSSLKAIGYKELFEYFKGNITKEEAIELIKKRSRNYAKRQYTWFNNQFEVNWFEVNFNDFNLTIKEVLEFLKGKKYE
jgi:tRNA dimethylallyltransferase